MHLPASLKSCRTRPSPAIRSSLCRSTPQPRTTCRGFACSAFRRDRSKKNSKRCSSKANEETEQNCDRTARKKWCRPTSARRAGRSPPGGLQPALDDRFHEIDHGTDNLLADSSFVVDQTRSGIMAGWRRAVELAIAGEENETLVALSRSRTEPASRVSRAAMLLAYREHPSFFAVGQKLGVHHQTVQRCVERAVAYGALAALDDRPRPGKEPVITPEAKAWLVSLACDKAKEHGYPHELWTTRLLARHAREHGPTTGHECLAKLVQGTVCKILGQEEIKPHKV